jgi:hypothetical protein
MAVPSRRALDRARLAHQLPLARTDTPVPAAFEHVVRIEPPA